MATTESIVVERPFKGRWNLVRDGVRVGHVIGDAVIGFTARDERNRIVGCSRIDTLSEALSVVFATDEFRLFEEDAS